MTSCYQWNWFNSQPKPHPAHPDTHYTLSAFIPGRCKAVFLKFCFVPCVADPVAVRCWAFIFVLFVHALFPVSILHKSIAGRYRPVRVADGPITARCRFKKNAIWVIELSWHLVEEKAAYLAFLWFAACVLYMLWFICASSRWHWYRLWSVLVLS